jgi:putative flippase GtrA
MFSGGPARAGGLPMRRVSRTLGHVSGRQTSVPPDPGPLTADLAPAPTLRPAPQNPHTVDSASAAAEVAHAAELSHVAGTGSLRQRAVALYDRFDRLIRELGKFGTVGGIAFVVDFVIFNVLRMAEVERLLSATISMAVAATLAFIGNRFWTWRDRERTGLRREYMLYFLFNLGGLLIALAVLGISAYGLGSIWPVFTTPLAENIAKMGVGTVLGTMFRFWSYRSIVFRSVG